MLALRFRVKTSFRPPADTAETGAAGRKTGDWNGRRTNQRDTGCPPRSQEPGRASRVSLNSDAGRGSKSPRSAIAYRNCHCALSSVFGNVRCTAPRTSSPIPLSAASDVARPISSIRNASRAGRVAAGLSGSVGRPVRIGRGIRAKLFAESVGPFRIVFGKLGEMGGSGDFCFSVDDDGARA
jgi:hypothetical protein